MSSNGPRVLLEERELEAALQRAREPGRGLALRREPRVELYRLPALVRGAELHPARIVDLSPGGAGLEALPHPIARTIEEIEFRLPESGEVVNVRVVPVWSVREPERSGVRFVFLDERVRDAIEAEVRAAWRLGCGSTT